MQSSSYISKSRRSQRPASGAAAKIGRVAGSFAGCQGMRLQLGARHHIVGLLNKASVTERLVHRNADLQQGKSELTTILVFFLL